MDCSPPGSSVLGILRQEYWSGLPFPPPRALPDPGIKPTSPSLAGRFFTTKPCRKPCSPSTHAKFFSILFITIYHYAQVKRWRIAKESACNAQQQTRIQSLSGEDSLEKEMATHSSIFTWKISWTEEPGKLQSVVSQSIGHN